MVDELNPYAPPQSVDEPPPQPRRASATPYHAASPVKVVLLTLATFGIYQIYWLYRQWKAVRARTGENLSPFWRAVFDIFFVNRLFPHIRADVQEAGVQTTGTTGVLVGVFILGEIINRITSRMEVGWLWVVSFVSVVPIVILQAEINQYLARVEPDGARRPGFGVGAIVVLLLGAATWALAVLGQIPS